MSNDLTPQLTRSFSQHRGERGVHFYDASECKFLSWQETMSRTSDNENFPTHFTDKLLEAMANYDPEREFVTCKAGNGQLTIELFKAQTL
jgi:hypothetical protein